MPLFVGTAEFLDFTTAIANIAYEADCGALEILRLQLQLHQMTSRFGDVIVDRSFTALP